MTMDGLILAGGKSTRMGGKHKGDLLYRDQTFTERIVQQFRKNAAHIWLSYGEVPGKAYEGCSVITDIYPGLGPIGGIYTCLTRCQSEAVMVAACDMPLIGAELFQYLSGRLDEEEKRSGIAYMAAVPVVEGRMHPLAAIYRIKIKERLKEQIMEKNYRIRDAFRAEDVLYVDLTREEKYRNMLRNVNTVEEYKQLTEL